MYYSGNQPIPYAKAFFVQASACYLWALVTPLVLWLARRYRIDRQNWQPKGPLSRWCQHSPEQYADLVHFVIYMIYYWSVQ